MSCIPLSTSLLDNTETIWLDRGRCEEEFTNFLIKTSETTHTTVTKPPTISERFENVKTRLKTARNADNNVEGGDRVAELEKRNAYLEERVRRLETELAKYKGRANEDLSDSQDDFDIDDDNDDDDDDDGEIEFQIQLHAKKKSRKLTPKSVLILDIKPEDENPDMSALEQRVRAVRIDGLRWGNSQIEERAKDSEILRISSLLEDEKVLMEDLKQTIVKLENVESMEIHCYNKI